MHLRKSHLLSQSLGQYHVVDLLRRKRFLYKRDNSISDIQIRERHISKTADFRWCVFILGYEFVIICLYALKWGYWKRCSVLVEFWCTCFCLKKIINVIAVVSTRKMLNADREIK